MMMNIILLPAVYRKGQGKKQKPSELCFRVPPKSNIIPSILWDIQGKMIIYIHPIIIFYILFNIYIHYTIFLFLGKKKRKNIMNG